MPEPPPYVKGANERAPTDYPKHGSAISNPPPYGALFAADQVSRIHAILQEADGEAALNRIREVIYGPG